MCKNRFDDTIRAQYDKRKGRIKILLVIDRISRGQGFVTHARENTTSREDSDNDATCKLIRRKITVHHHFNVKSICLSIYPRNSEYFECSAWGRLSIDPSFFFIIIFFLRFFTSIFHIRFLFHYPPRRRSVTVRFARTV